MSKPAAINPWLVTVGCMLALTTSSGVTQAFTFSLFIEPITTEFGWSRAVISLGYSAVVLTTAVGSPLVGRLIDRFGVRSVLVVAIVFYALGIGSIGLIPALPIAFVGLYAITGLFGAAHSPVPYAKVLSGWFDARRGLALGIAMAGIGIGGVAVPALTAAILKAYDWRVAYFALGATVALVSLPAVLLLVRERAQAHSSNSISALPGMSLKEAMTSVRFWMLIAVVALVSLVLNGCAAHAVPLLTSHDLPRAAALSLLPAMGGASLAGRVAGGYLLDRMFAPFVAAVFVLVALAGVAVFWMGGGLLAMLLGLICLGFALGAEVDVIGYLTSRYFGLRRFGEIYGYMIAAFCVAGAIGAALMGVSFDATESYRMALVVFAAALVIAAILVVRLGPYVFPAEPETSSV